MYLLIALYFNMFNLKKNQKKKNNFIDFNKKKFFLKISL